MRRGGALLPVLLVLLILSLLAFSALDRSSDDLLMSHGEGDAARALHAAEAGIEALRSWVAEEWLASRGGKCVGSAEKPDFSLSPTLPKARPDLPEIPFPSAPLETLVPAAVASLRVYAASQGGICTLEASGRLPMSEDSVSVELERVPLPPIRWALAIGAGSPAPRSPLSVHWGEAYFQGDADLGRSVDEIPIRDPDTPPMFPPEILGPTFRDAWVGFFAGERYISPAGCRECPVPYPLRPNVRQYFTSKPTDFDLQLLREFAIRHGSYAEVQSDGTVGDGLTLESWLAASRGKGVFFINAAEGKVVLRSGGTPGVFIISGDAEVAPSSEPVNRGLLSPPFPSAGGERRRVDLPIHFSGVLHVAGTLTIANRFAIFGSVYAWRIGGETAGLQIWFDSSLSKGIFPGVERLVLRPGTWHEGEM